MRSARPYWTSARRDSSRSCQDMSNLSPGSERLHSDVDLKGVVAANPLGVVLKLLQLYHRGNFSTPAPKRGRGQVGLEYPQFLAHEARLEPDFIGREALGVGE